MSADYLIINLLEDLGIKPRASLVLSKPSSHSIPKSHPQSRLLVKETQECGSPGKKAKLSVDTLTAPQTTGKQELQGQDSGISCLSQVAGQPPRLSSLLHKPKSMVWCHKPRAHPRGGSPLHRERKIDTEMCSMPRS